MRTTSTEYRVIMKLRSTYSGESLVYHGLHGHVRHALELVVDDQLRNELGLCYISVTPLSVDGLVIRTKPNM